MKRKDLTPGMVVEVRSGKPDGPYTTYDRAIVLSLDPWETRKSAWLTVKNRHVPAHDPRAKGVPVARESSSWSPGGPVKSWIPDVVQTGQLVPAGTGHAEAERRKAERDAAKAQQRATDERLEADRVEIRGRLEALGIDSAGVRVDVHVILGKGMFRQLLTLAEQAGNMDEIRSGLRWLRDELGEMDPGSGTFHAFMKAQRLERLAAGPAVQEEDTDDV